MLILLSRRFATGSIM
uniref:Uncharacterized protein n=1 Tax=Arundo donax TaxID=35708 RepID=A0A0A8Y8V0_ARUDO